MSDTPRMDNVRHNVAELAVFARQLERELNDANQTNITLLEDREQLRRQLEEANRRNVTLIEERDSARIQADHKWRLREEFEALLGTSDVETGVERVKEAQNGAARYEYIRKLNPREFAALSLFCITSGIHFDTVVDRGRKET